MDVDGIMEILSRLPVRSLLRFKCVSKFWMAFISEPYFTLKHLNHAKNDQNSQRFLVSQWSSLYCSSLSSVQRVEEVQKLDCPSNAELWRCFLYCCYDSLALIGVYNYLVHTHQLWLWNPSTRESIVLLGPKFPPDLFFTWGLGYDSVSDNYKILKIDLKSRSEILTLKSGSWRLTNKYPIGVHPELLYTDSLVFVHGAFHWISDITGFTVTALSISTESYRNIGFRMVNCYSAAEIWLFVLSLGHPKDHLDYVLNLIPLGKNRNRAKNDQNSQKFLVNRKDLLEDEFLLYCSSLSSVQRIEEVQKLDCPSNVGNTFRFWVMKDYGITESWAELLTIPGPDFLSVIPKYRFSDGVVLLCYRNRGLRTVLRTSKAPLELRPQSDFSQTEALDHHTLMKFLLDFDLSFKTRNLLYQLHVFGGLKYTEGISGLQVWNAHQGQGPNSGHEKLGITARFMVSGDDYKILKIDGKERNEILELKSGSWRKIDDHPATDNPVLSDMNYLEFQHGALDCIDMGYLTFVHGAFHWVDSLLNQSVVTFSISDEVYREIPLPEGLDLFFDIMHSKQGVSVLGGMLYVYSTRIHHWEYTFKLWVMNDQLRRSGSVFKKSNESYGVWPRSDSECGIPYKYDIPRSIWNPPLTRRVSLQPENTVMPPHHIIDQNSQADEVRPTHGIWTHNRDHTPELVPTLGVPPVPTSQPQAPRTDDNHPPTT
ncbi:hypothetical protein CQW23_29190 [Capsicum baccatum]|uniref:F-box domain-containing protein n=1 Tax=Capsicum baccatum TaxID=33114 RepID=A0A2G2VIQ9_CAPBA|nr:hypothetical protein CQW23_29190 [Capsicum baccatum]